MNVVFFYYYYEPNLRFYVLGKISIEHVKKIIKKEFQIKNFLIDIKCQQKVIRVYRFTVGSQSRPNLKFRFGEKLNENE